MSSSCHTSIEGDYFHKPSLQTDTDFAPRLVKEDRRIRFGHVLLGPLLWREDGWLPFPRKEGDLVPNYYKGSYKGQVDPSEESLRNVVIDTSPASDVGGEKSHASGAGKPQAEPGTETADGINPERDAEEPVRRVEAKELQSVDQLPFLHPKRLFTIAKYVLLRGITKDVIMHQSKGLAHVHARAPRYDNKVEHLWTAAQVTSAMIMSIAHGSNDVANAIGPFTTEYLTWKSGVSSAKVDTPTWIRAVGGLGLGFGFWTYGYHLMRNLGNKITHNPPPRGYSMKSGTAVTV